MLGEVVARLKKEKLLRSTVILFMADHGISHARGKQFLYDEGLHVPLVVAGPQIKAGEVRDDLVEHIDIAAFSQGLAGIPIPESMQARNILATDYKPREAVFAARDRCDETVDHIRSVRTTRYKCIRNFLPNRPYLQPNANKDKKSIVIALRQAKRDGLLNDAHKLMTATSRPVKELYDLESDSHELHNLANSETHQKQLEEMRERLKLWMVESNDMGRQPESATMFNSDMEVYLNSLRARKKDPAYLKLIEINIDLMRQWAREGKQSRLSAM